MLGSMDGGKLTQLVGKENVGVATMMKDNQDLLKQYVDELAALTGKMDVVGEKLGKMYGDPMFGTVETIKAAKQHPGERAADAGAEPGCRRRSATGSCGQAGADATTPPLLSWFKKPAVWMETLGFLADGRRPRRRGVSGRRGRRSRPPSALDAGDKNLATAAELSQRQATGTFYKRARTSHWPWERDYEKVYTDENDAAEAMRMVGHGWRGITAGSYTEYKTLQDFSPRKAREWEEQHRPLPQPSPADVPVAAGVAAAGAAAALGPVGMVFLDAARMIARGARDVAAHR
jgi:hypothetical protein